MMQAMEIKAQPVAVQDSIDQNAPRAADRSQNFGIFLRHLTSDPISADQHEGEEISHEGSSDVLELTDRGKRLSRIVEVFFPLTAER